MPENIPQQGKLEFFDRIEEECTGSYDSDGELDPLFDSNEDEDGHDFDEDSRPVSQPVLVEGPLKFHLVPINLTGS